MHFARVPVEVAEKILEQENLSAKRDANRKPAIRKSGRIPAEPHTLSRKTEVTSE
jgi:hypothetical protein